MYSFKDTKIQTAFRVEISKTKSKQIESILLLRRTVKFFKNKISENGIIKTFRLVC